MLPSRQQWQRWSLPSRLTFVGTVCGVLSIVLSLILWRFPPGSQFQPGTPTSPDPPALTTAVVHRAISDMIREFPGMRPLRVLEVTSSVNGLAAARIEPPYRDFPNVVLFQYHDTEHRWRRVFEGLSLGIQFEPSGTLDIHTLGEAMDVAHTSSGPDTRAYVTSLGFGHGWIPVSYEKFVHLHQSGRESYYLDKGKYGSLASRLIPEAKDGFPDDECTLFDTPELMTLSLSHASGRYELHTETANNQRWTVTFTGISADGYLVHKLITAEIEHD